MINLREWGPILILGLVGVGLVGYGMWEQIRPREVVVEIVKGSQSSDHSLSQGSERGELVVDIAGEVEKPGVYKLLSGSRIGDALVLAGGLSANADREWVARMINLAELVKDGGKVYIPAKQEVSGTTTQQTNASTQLQGKVNINTASMGELDGLAGIGEVRAQAIIDSRPYGSIQELVSKAKIPESVYEKIKDQVSVY